MSDEVPNTEVKSKMMAAKCTGGEVVPTSASTTSTTQTITLKFSGIKVVVIELDAGSHSSVLEPDQITSSTSMLSKRSSDEMEGTDTASSSAKKIKISEAKIINKEEESNADEDSARAFRTEAPASPSSTTEVTNDSEMQNEERQSDADEDSACAFRTEAPAGTSKKTEVTNDSEMLNQERQSDADEHSARAFRTEALAGPSKEPEQITDSETRKKKRQSDADEHSARAFRTEALAGPSKEPEQITYSEIQKKKQQSDADEYAAHLLLRLTDLAVVISGAAEEYRELLQLEQVMDGPLGEYYNTERRVRSRLLVTNFEKRRKLIRSNHAILISAYQERFIPLLTAEVNKISSVGLTPKEVRKIIDMIQDSAVCFTAASQSFLRTQRGQNWLQDMLFPRNHSGNDH